MNTIFFFNKLMFCLPLIYHMASEEIYSAWVILMHVMDLNAFVHHGSHITSIEIAEGEQEMKGNEPDLNPHHSYECYDTTGHSTWVNYKATAKWCIPVC